MNKPLIFATALTLAIVLPMYCIEIKQVSFDNPELCDGASDCVDSRDVTVTNDGRCFVYTSEAINGDSLLTGYADWRIWKTCNVFEEMDIVNTLVSPVSDVGYDYTFSSASNDGNRVCYSSKFPNYRTNIGLSDLDTGMVKNITDADTSLDSKWCDISADGSTIVFESEMDSLVEDAEIVENLEQIFITEDEGSSYSLLVPNEVINESESTRAQVSGDGSFVTFHAKNIQIESESPSSLTAYEEWLYRRSDGKITRITDFYGNECNKTLMFELMVEMWGAQNLSDVGLTENSLGNGQTQCQFFASKGLIKSAGVIDVRDNPSRISDDGRFLTFMASFDASTIRGTYEEESVVTTRNLFLKDNVLGMIWLITKEGPAGPEYEEKLKNFCCPYASSSYQPGTCTREREYKGFCCWQRPCGHPGVNMDLSGDGTSIVYTTDGYPNLPEVNMDWEIYHYHIPTSTTTIITNTTNRDYDDFFPSISAKGDVVAWTSDFNYETSESITSNNQIFAAKLLYGCSLDVTASNYVANPDVEVCCEWENPPWSTSCGSALLCLHFEGDANELFSSVPFTTGTNEEKIEFVENYALQVKNDISCSLGIPNVHVDTYADVDSFFSDMTVFVKFKEGTPAAYSAELLIEQYNDPASRLWKGYLTKTLKNGLDLDYSYSYCIKKTRTQENATCPRTKKSKKTKKTHEPSTQPIERPTKKT